MKICAFSIFDYDAPLFPGFQDHGSIEHEKLHTLEKNRIGSSISHVGIGVTRGIKHEKIRYFYFWTMTHRFFRAYKIVDR